jgi:hypothetical protein
MYGDGVDTRYDYDGLEVGIRNPSACWLFCPFQGRQQDGGVSTNNEWIESNQMNQSIEE